MGIMSFWLQIALCWLSKWIAWVGQEIEGVLVGDSYGPVQWEMAHVRKRILGYINLDQWEMNSHWIPSKLRLSFYTPYLLYSLSIMTNPIDIASGTNTRTIFKESLGELCIQQFHTCKHHHVQKNMIMPYPLVGQVAGVCSLFYELRLTNYG